MKVYRCSILCDCKRVLMGYKATTQSQTFIYYFNFTRRCTNTTDGDKKQDRNHEKITTSVINNTYISVYTTIEHLCI